AGVFRMGSPVSERNHERDEFAHEVKLPRPFYLGVFPVAQSQFEPVMGTNPSQFQPRTNQKAKGVDTRNFPVESVTWDEAVEFCGRLTRQGAATGEVYRLPTEAEWEHACRGGSACTAPFHYGGLLSSARANFNGQFPSGRVKPGKHLGRPTAVGSYRPNVLG